MSDDKAQQEPSMEDILASIRRILSEDEAEEKSKAPMPEPEPEPEPMAAAPLPQDDIDAMFSSAPAPAPEPEPEFEMPDLEPMPMSDPEPEEEDDVLELTEDMVFDEPEEEPAFDLSAFKPGADFDFEPEPEPEPMPPPRRIRQVVEDDEDLISQPVAQRSTSLLTDLAREIVRQRAIGLGNGGVTLEDMVRELLRPILKEWLDENLPYMIERIVKQEIEKMVNRAENY
jgi:cell pole-organizing protein PopZ